MASDFSILEIYCFKTQMIHVHPFVYCVALSIHLTPHIFHYYRYLYE